MEESNSCGDRKDNVDLIDLPPGFRFHPTDEEIISYYLWNRTLDNSFTSIAIADANFNKCEPWDLPKMAKMGDNTWYFYCRRDRKYPTGTRTNRATTTGYWKATGKDKEIRAARGTILGMKKTLVFYVGRAPRGSKSNWVMHEYRLVDGNLSLKEDWVICKVLLRESARKAIPTFVGTSPGAVDDYRSFPSADSRYPDFLLLHSQNPLLNTAFPFEASPFSAACLPRQQLSTDAQQNYIPTFGIGSDMAAFRGAVDGRHDDVSTSEGPDRIGKWLDEKWSTASLSQNTGLTVEGNGEISSATRSTLETTPTGIDGWSYADDPFQIQQLLYLADGPPPHAF